MDPLKLRAWSFVRQGLDGALAAERSEVVLARTGWVRSVGGASPYLALHARNGASRAGVDADVAALALLELPTARGCTYVLPAADYATGLRAGQGFGSSATTIASAKKHLGVTDAGLDRLDEAVLAVVGECAMDPRALKEVLGERVRSLGAEGKAKGTATTLPLSLGRLQGLGQIRRVPLDGRLDRQRYAYALWSPCPLAGDSRTLDEVCVDLARLYFRWVGYATVAQFQAFSALGAKGAKAALSSLGLVPLSPGDPRLVSPEDLDSLRSFQVPSEERIALIPTLDGLILHRREIEPLLDPEDLGRPIWTERGSRPGSALMDLSQHAIVDRGRLIGFWDWDVQKDEAVWATFQPPSAGVRAAVARTATFVREELGDARTFSLDSPEGRTERIEALRRGFF